MLLLLLLLLSIITLLYRRVDGSRNADERSDDKRNAMDATAVTQTPLLRSGVDALRLDALWHCLCDAVMVLELLLRVCI